MLTAKHLKRPLALHNANAIQDLPVCHHGFTHFDLEIEPVLVSNEQPVTRINESAGQRWVALSAIADVGIPAVVDRLLDQVMKLRDRGTDVII